MKEKVTVRSLQEIQNGETVTFEGLNASEIDSGKSMASIYGKRMECRFICSSDYAEGKLTITREDAQ